MHSLRVAVKIVIGFIFSITVVFAFLTVSLFGVKAEDTVQIVVTEATGLQREMVVFHADLQPMIIHNLFWVCLASLGFMLIVLYFIDNNFKVFLAPGLLCLSITIMLSLILIMFLDNIFHYTGQIGDLYVQTALVRFRQAALGISVFGLLLVAAAVWGDRLIKIKKH